MNTITNCSLQFAQCDVINHGLVFHQWAPWTHEHNEVKNSSKLFLTKTLLQHYNESEEKLNEYVSHAGIEDISLHQPNCLMSLNEVCLCCFCCLFFSSRWGYWSLYLQGCISDLSHDEEQQWWGYKQTSGKLLDLYWTRGPTQILLVRVRGLALIFEDWCCSIQTHNISWKTTTLRVFQLEEAHWSFSRMVKNKDLYFMYSSYITYNKPDTAGV